MKAGEKYLVTTDEWFIAPDGETYRSAWGEVEVIEDSFLKIKTNSRSANWFLKVGSEKNHVIIAGCQVHYAVKSNNKPQNKDIGVESWHDGSLRKDRGSTRIYIAE